MDSWNGAKRINDVVWEIPTSYKEGMKVPARFYANESAIKEFDEQVFNQLTNVATLPGIQKSAMCMPDGHSGYGFPIGGVAAFDINDGGIISPGGIGFDINCGMRLITTNLTRSEVQEKLKPLVDDLFRSVPAGVGGKGPIQLTYDQFNELMSEGAGWAIKNGQGWEDDKKFLEANGCIKDADPDFVSDMAKKRGLKQAGTLGSGNHYLEIQYTSEDSIFDEKAARAMGITGPDQVVIMFHCGSRGFGHQIGSDYLKKFLEIMPKYNLKVLDKELACAPFNSEEGQSYYKAMAAAANFGFANRQIILDSIRKSFERIFGKSAEEMNMNVVYDVAHNIAKLEKYKIDGKMKNLLVHRKGATRCFGPGHPEIPEKYQEVGQPVIVGGSMETGSYLCAGTKKAEEETFGSTMHGAGRTMSRHEATRNFKGQELLQKMDKMGIYVHAVSMKGLAEEAGKAYKDINDVVGTMDTAGISKKVAHLKPMGNVKG